MIFAYLFHNRHVELMRSVHYYPEEFEEVLDDFAARKVVFLFRDPRDVIVSMAFEKEVELDLFVQEIEEVIRFYNLWYEYRSADIHFVSYEGLWRDPVGEVRSICEFVGYEAPALAIKSAVSYSKFRNMKRIELSGHGNLLLHFKSKFGRKAAENPRCRRGVCGGFVDYLTPLQQRYCWDEMQALHPFYLKHYVESPGS
jgi:hypothetical protein